MFTENEGHLLIKIVRQAIEKKLGLEPSDPVPDKDLLNPSFQVKRGVFVTLNKRGMLRGCIGSLSGVETVVEGIKRHAVNAAFNDHRFPPLTSAELPDVSINISILTEPRDLQYEDADDLVRKLRPEIDGVILKEPDGGGATFLPQVWEQLPSPDLFLGHLCRKAGLTDDAWKSSHLLVQTYQVQYFKE